jgi:hypothetical protein
VASLSDQLADKCKQVSVHMYVHRYMHLSIPEGIVALEQPKLLCACACMDIYVCVHVYSSIFFAILYTYVYTENTWT